MTKFAIGRWLKAADDAISAEPVWPVPATTDADIEALQKQRDGAIGAEMYQTQRAEHFERRTGHLEKELGDISAALLLLCACTAATPTELVDGTPIGDQLAADLKFEGWV